MKSIRCLCAILLVLVMVFSLVACGDSGTVDQTADTARETQPITIRLASLASRGGVSTEFMYQFADALAAKTDKFVVELYPGGQFGNANEMVNAVQTNILQGVVFTTSWISGLCPIVEAIAVPYLFPDHETCVKILNQGIDVITNGFQEANLYPGCWLANGVYWTYSTTPINEVSDLRGLNIRTPATDINNDVCEAYGANLVNLTTADVPVALQQGAIDATFAPLSVGYSSFLGSFQYMIRIHGDAYNSPDCFILSNEFLQSLSEEDRTLFLETAMEVSYGDSYNFYLECLDMYMETIIEDGVQVIPDSEELHAQMREVLMPVKENYPTKYPNLADGYYQIVAAVEAYTN